MTSLYLCYDHWIDILDLLMDLGASLTVESEDGRSHLFYAAEGYQLGIVRVINHAAEVTAKDLAPILINWTDKREETVKTVEAVLEVHRPSCHWPHWPLVERLRGHITQVTMDILNYI